MAEVVYLISVVVVFKAREHMLCIHLKEIVEFIFDRKLLNKTGKFRDCES